MARLRLAALLLLLALALAPLARAAGNGSWLLTVFETVCLAKPGSIAALDALATTHGFVRKPFDASKPFPLPQTPEDEASWLGMWRLGEGSGKIDLTGLTSGNADGHTLSCLMNTADVAPDDIIAGVKRLPGIEGPELRRDKADKATLEWTLTGDLHQGKVALFYDPTRGRQLLGLTYDQVFVAK